MKIWRDEQARCWDDRQLMCGSPRVEQIWLVSLDEIYSIQRGHCAVTLSLYSRLRLDVIFWFAAINAFTITCERGAIEADQHDDVVSCSTSTVNQQHAWPQVRSMQLDQSRSSSSMDAHTVVQYLRNLLLASFSHPLHSLFGQ